MQIKNIIFDLGQVLLNLNFEATKLAFEDIGFKNHANMFGKYSGSKAFHDFETGHLSAEAFYNEVRKEANNNDLTNEKICNAWNAMLGHIPQCRLQLLNTLKANYNLYLYSNTNEIHYAYFQKGFYESNLTKLDTYFTASYYSHLFGYRKPNKESFELLLNDANINAENSLFIDDGDANILGAKEAGLHTMLITSGITIEKDLQQLLFQLH